MTIAVAVNKGNDIFLGADTQANFGSNKVSHTNINFSKIRQIGASYIATSGWGLYDDIFADYLTKKKDAKLINKMEIFRFFKKFWHALHKDYSFVNDQCDDDESPFGELDASFLVATPDSIFHVSSNMNVTEFLKFYAVGSGCEFAIGAMHVLYDTDCSAKDIAKKGIETAIANNVYCGGKIDLIQISGA